MTSREQRAKDFPDFDPQAVTLPEVQIEDCELSIRSGSDVKVSAKVANSNAERTASVEMEITRNGQKTGQTIQGTVPPESSAWLSNIVFDVPGGEHSFGVEVINVIAA